MGLLEDRVVVVTGGSRGIGKGIALALGATGATVYVTGRTTETGQRRLPGTIHETAQCIDERGGRGVALACDHRDDAAVEAAFQRVKDEHGRLDILVNNASAVPRDLIAPGPFWKKSLTLASVLEVGLRSHYVASYFAAPLLIEGGEGLVVNISSFGGRCYMHGPAYGAGKAGTDKLAADMAVDFEEYGVAVLSLWPGIVRTERNHGLFENPPPRYREMLESGESVEFCGRIIDALARDPKLLERSGRTLISAEIAAELGVVDIDGRRPVSRREKLGDPLEPSTVRVR